jgi:hypothetical protein
MSISKSPDRHTFQAEAYIKRCEEEGAEPSEDYLNLYKSARQQDEENIVDTDWQKDNLEYDLRSTEWILEKARTRDSYAQNIYAALCNMRWQKIDVFPILKDEYWSCSWRHAGGIVADMRGEGDYIDWYCSGIRGDPNEIDYESAREQGMDLANYVGEGTVTDEVLNDMKTLGWQPVEWDDDDY